MYFNKLNNRPLPLGGHQLLLAKVKNAYGRIGIFLISYFFRAKHPSIIRKCAECGREFPTKSELKRHELTHTGEKQHSCPECGKCFAAIGNLNQHIAGVHRGIKPFQCTVCGLNISQKSNLANHMRTHTGEKPFSCVVCGKSFARKTDCKKHTMTVHNKK